MSDLRLLTSYFYKKENKMYYIYMLRCENNSIYTGIAKDLKRRMAEHFSQDEKCAKYTKSHRPKKLEMVWETQDKSLAAKLEYAIKTLNKVKKEELIKNPKLLEDFLGNRIETSLYKKSKR